MSEDKKRRRAEHEVKASEYEDELDGKQKRDKRQENEHIKFFVQIINQTV